MIIGFIVGVVVCIALFDIIFMIGANAIKDAINQSFGYDDYNSLKNKEDGRVLQEMSIQRLRLPIFQGGFSLNYNRPSKYRSIVSQQPSSRHGYVALWQTLYKKAK